MSYLMTAKEISRAILCPVCHNYYGRTLSVVQGNLLCDVCKWHPTEDQQKKLRKIVWKMGKYHAV